MRLAPAILLVLLAAPALAQDPPPVPDTTAAWQYYPLEVGNVWEYDVRVFGEPHTYWRREVLRDTMIGDHRYFLEIRLRAEDGDSGWSPGFPHESWLRYDSTSTRVMRWSASGEIMEVCDLGADFGSEIDCYEGVGHPDTGGPEETGVGGGYGGHVVIAGESVGVLAKKVFVPLGPVDPGSFSVYVAPLGYAGETPGYCSCFADLTYVHLVTDAGVIEYGAPLPLANDPPAPVVGLSLAAYPSPTAGPVTLALSVSVPQGVKIEVFDALGRRVHAEARAVSGSAQLSLDARGWAPGVYVVRVTAGNGATATARLVRK